MTDDTKPAGGEKPAKKEPVMVDCPVLKMAAVIGGVEFKAGDNPKGKFKKHIVDDLRKRGAI